MSNNIAIIGTTSTHGGRMITASGSDFSTKSGAVCCVGDTHQCPTHGNSAIVSGGSTGSTVKGKALAVNGSVAGCGAVLNGNFAPDCTTI